MWPAHLTLTTLALLVLPFSAKPGCKENKELVKYWWPNREQTQRACGEAETIAFVYLITQEPKYAEAARKWVLHLASWNPDETNTNTSSPAHRVDTRPWRVRSPPRRPSAPAIALSWPPARMRRRRASGAVPAP